MTKAERERNKLIEKKFGRRKELISEGASVYPQSAEREMTRYLKRYTRELRNIMTRADAKVASGKPKKVVFSEVKQELVNLSKKYNTVAEIGKISRLVVSSEEKQFRKSFKKTIGLDMPQFDADQFKEEESEWVADTLGLLGVYLLEINRQIDNEIERDSGDVREDGKVLDKISGIFSRILKKAGDISSIARNRIGDLMAKVNNGIYQLFGVERYVWRTRRDGNVRDCHKSFDGHIFRVDDPPEIWYMTKHGRIYTGRFCNPGEDYNCRCKAIPLFTKEAVYTILTREKWKEKTGAV